jgi:hypothetical protein
MATDQRTADVLAWIGCGVVIGVLVGCGVCIGMYHSTDDRLVNLLSGFFGDMCVLVCGCTGAVVGAVAGATCFITYQERHERS